MGGALYLGEAKKKKLECELGMGIEQYPRGIIIVRFFLATACRLPFLFVQAILS